MVKKTEKLYMELSALENRGVTIWLEGTPSNSLNVSNQLSIHEDTSYMRDYVFEEGRLKEVRGVPHSNSNLFSPLNLIKILSLSSSTISKSSFSPNPSF